MHQIRRLVRLGRGANTPYDEVAPFDGHIERPLLTMHGTGDLFMPIFLQQTLKRAVVPRATTGGLRNACTASVKS